MMALTGASPDGFSAVDGSGLSRANRCTPRQQTSLLRWVQRQSWSELFRQSLAVAGVDGSLRRRLREHPGRVVAKTGTMRGVRALAGYVMNGSQPRYAFAVVFNDYPGPSTPYREIQDRFCRALVREADR